MIGRMVTANAVTDSNTGAGTQLLMSVGSGAVMVLERAAISQISLDSSEQSDASIRAFAIGSTGGDAVVENAADTTATVSTTVTVEGTIAIAEGSSTETVYYHQGWNLLSGFLWTPASDDEGILNDLSSELDLAIPGTNVANTWHCDVTFREFGT